MVSLSRIALPNEAYEVVSLDALQATQELNDRSTLMYRRFYGLESVVRHSTDLPEMLSDVLKRALDRIPDVESQPGQLVYCKTQTHNTLTDRGWLRRLADNHGLHHWEVYTLSMTSCASALVQLHMAEHCATDEPIIILTGEKAFHPWVSRLPVGLLSEVPAAAVLNAGQDSWRISGTSVRHLSRFHRNPDTMSAADRRALQATYADSLIEFMEASLSRYCNSVTREMVFLLHNLNRSMTDTLVRHFGWEARTFHGDLSRIGHAYCSDCFINLSAFERAGRPERQVLILAAGTGVTFATCLLDRIPAI